jgi:hypothetical protein
LILSHAKAVRTKYETNSKTGQKQIFGVHIIPPRS